MKAGWRKQHRGFTIVELLIVIVVIAYGTYSTGNVPTVKNVQIQLAP